MKSVTWFSPLGYLDGELVSRVKPGEADFPLSARLNSVFEMGRILWDTPPMKLVSDDRCRIQSRDLFKPDTPYDAERNADGQVVLKELVPAQARTVRPRRVNVRLRGADVVLRPETIAAAVRADRDSR